MTNFRLKSTRTTKASDAPDNIRFSGIAIAIMIVLMVVAALVALLLDNLGASDLLIGIIVLAILLVAFYILLALKVAQQWEKAVVLRLGKFRGLRGPGAFWIIPILDTTPNWIDHRVMVTPFNAEKTLTKDTVPVDVDAVLFWMVWDAEKAALEVADYRAAIAWAAQTALREVIGQMNLADILVGRDKVDAVLQKIIDERTTPWGVTVQSVEIRDVVIPQDLEDTMSRQAQAERERQARVILGESEKQIAQSFCRSLPGLHQQPDRPAPARHEHALRRLEGKRRPGHRAQQRRRYHEPGRHERPGFARSHHPASSERGVSHGRRH